MYKIFEKGYEIVKCKYHGILNIKNNAIESAQKSDKINWAQRKNFTQGINKIDKLLDQTNYNTDKDTTIKNKKAICKKLNGFAKISGTNHPEFSEIANINF